MGRAGSDWALFVDWCVAAGERALPATPATVLAFLEDVAGARPPLARRARAVDSVHRLVGANEPGGDALAALTGARPRYDPGVVAGALRAAPVGGWPGGLVGRRDAAVVALVCVAGLERDEVRRIRLGEDWRALAESLPVACDASPCPRCALARWVRARLAVAEFGWRSARVWLEEAGATLSAMAVDHECAGFPTSPTGPAEDEAAFVAVGHGGQIELAPLSRRSVSAIVSATLAAARQPRVTVQTTPTAWHTQPPGAKVVQLHRLEDLEIALQRAEELAEAALSPLFLAEQI